MNILENVQYVILIIPPILLALSFHEYMHGLVAYNLGDPTAARSGRLTMNPFSHLDPIGTLMIFLVHFGWAKPVPVNPMNLRDPKKSMVYVSISGPLANMFLAFLSGLFLRGIRGGFIGIGLLPESMIQAIYTMVAFSLRINIALAFFNLLPIPPLDGSKILFGLLPSRYQHIAEWLEQNGGFILMGLIMFGFVTNVSIIGAYLDPFIQVFSKIFGGV